MATLPLKVLNRLRQGRDIAAKVPNTPPGHCAWVYVYPLIDSKKGQMLKEPGREIRVVSREGDNPIRGFPIRYLETEEKYVEEIYQGRIIDLTKTIKDIKMQVESEEELTAVLQKWIADLSSFHVPIDTGYWFEQGGDLIR